VTDSTQEKSAATDEAGLLAALRAGDERAFAEAYARYRPRLYSFLARLTGRPALAEDLVQETFVRLARSAAELRADTRLGAWLFTVARNLFSSHRRWALLDLDRLGELRLWAALQPPEPSPFVLAAVGETERRLEQALAELPLVYREIVLLTAVESMTPSEAAAVLGLSAPTARKRLDRARAMLAQSLGEDE
jgi:RNA polymerase sigma-70 factor (ECF subfamily)